MSLKRKYSRLKRNYTKYGKPVVKDISKVYKTIKRDIKKQRQGNTSKKKTIKPRYVFKGYKNVPVKKGNEWEIKKIPIVKKEFKKVKKINTNIKKKSRNYSDNPFNIMGNFDL